VHCKLLCACLTVCCVQEALCSAVSFEQHSLVLLEAEPALYWIIYAQSAYLSFPISTERAKSCLKSMNNLFRLMYRSLTSVIESQGYLAARGALKDFLNAFMPGFCRQEGWCTLHSLYTPMTAQRGLPFIPLKDPCFQGVAPYHVIGFPVHCTSSYVDSMEQPCGASAHHNMTESSQSS
jgi:hypothetical protein